MDRSRQHEERTIEEVFAEAVERVVAGELPDVVASSYERAYEAELRDLLAIVHMTHDMALATVPPISEAAH